MTPQLRRRSILAMGAAAIASGWIRDSAAADNPSIRFSYQTGDVNVMLMFVAGSGLFQKHKVDVKLLGFAAGPQQLPALASGDADLAWMGEFPAITSFANGLPIKLFFIESTKSGHQRIVARPDAGIRSLANMKGKRFGVTIGSTSHFLALLALSKVGLTAADVQLVNLSPENMPPAYLADRVDAVLTWEPNITTIERAGGVRIATAADLGRYTASVIVGRAQFLNGNGDAVQRFLSAWNEGVVQFYRDPAKALPFEAQRLKMSTDEMAALLKRQNNYNPSMGEQLTTNYLGTPGELITDNRYVFPHLLEIADFLVQLKRIPSERIEWASLIDPNPVALFLKTHG